MLQNEIYGDLIQLALDGQFDTIIHGCNCFCSMGAGIARTIREIFPEAYLADQATTSGDKEKLGTYTSALSKGITIINAYTQYDCTGYRPVDYSAIKRVFIALNRDLSPDKMVGIPLIGAGLAGGDWSIICNIITEVTPDLPLTLVHYSP